MEVERNNLKSARKITLEQLRRDKYEWTCVREEAERLGVTKQTVINRCFAGKYVVRQFLGLAIIRPATEGQNSAEGKTSM